MSSIKKPELLAPAGTLECAIMAYECGADAVYAGLQRFNARAKGKNMTFEDMSKLSAYAKQHNKKFYVVVNTVIKETELAEVAKDLAALATLEPDSVIVQDIGIAYMVRKFMPNTLLHASTQMGIHNTAGINVAKDMGASRVILEREVTLDELRSIMKKTPLEIEIFIHGALCSSLSGNCIWSSWIGGWSGNRGSCKQVCRRRFHTDENEQSKKAGFFFSTSDMYALDLIPMIKEMGIASLKIEGRLKQPDYVKNVVTAYRMMLDAPEGKEKEVLGKAKNVLSASPGRKWSHGFLSEKDMSTLIQFDTMGVSGQICGNVVNTNERGFTIEATRRIHIGDRLRIQPKSGDEGPAVTITKMSVNRKLTNKATKGEQVFIFCNKEVPHRGIVFKVGQSVANQSAKLASLPLYIPKHSINLDVQVSAKGITVNIPALPELGQWKDEFSIEQAQKRALDSSTVADAFTATRADQFKAGNVNVRIFGDLFLPASVLKQKRRAFWEWAAEQLATVDFSNVDDVYSTFIKEYKSLEPASAARERDICMVGKSSDKPRKRGTIIVRSIYDYNKKVDEVILPHFLKEDKVVDLKRRIDEVYSMGCRRFRVTSLFHIELLKEYKDIARVSSYPFPVLNSAATLQLKSFGFSRVQGWLELEDSEFKAFIGKSQLPVEIYRYGRPFLFATRADVHVEGNVSDSRGVEFSVECNKPMGINYVYPKQVLSIPKMDNTANFYDLTHAWWNEKNTYEFNLNHELK